MAFSILYNTEGSIRSRLHLAHALYEFKEFDASDIDFEPLTLGCNLKNTATGTCTWTEKSVENQYHSDIGHKILRQITLDRFRKEMNFTKGLEPRQVKYEHFYNEQMEVTDLALADQYLRLHTAMQYLTSLCLSLWEDYARDEVAFFVKYQKFNRFGLVNVLVARTSEVPSFHIWLFYILMFLVKSLEYTEDASGIDLMKEWVDPSSLKDFLEEITLSDLVTFAPFIRIYYLEHIDELCTSVVWNIASSSGEKGTTYSPVTSPSEKLATAWEEVKSHERTKQRRLSFPDRYSFKPGFKPPSAKSQGLAKILTQKHEIMQELDELLLSLCIFIVDRNFFRDTSSRENVYTAALLGYLGNEGRRHIYDGQKILKRRKIKNVSLKQYVNNRMQMKKAHRRAVSWELDSIKEYYEQPFNEANQEEKSPLEISTHSPVANHGLDSSGLSISISSLSSSPTFSTKSDFTSEKKKSQTARSPSPTPSAKKDSASFFKRDYERFFTRNMRILSESEKAFFSCLLQICLYLAVLHFNAETFTNIDNIDPMFRDLIATVVCLFIFFYSLRFQKCEFPINFVSVFFRVGKLPQACMLMDFLVNVCCGILLPYLTPFLLRGSEGLDDMLFNAIAVYFILDLDDILVTEHNRIEMEDDRIFTYLFIMQKPTQPQIDYTTSQKCLKFECYLAKVMSVISSMSCIVGILFFFKGQDFNLSFFGTDSA
mmetsp:Transcript_38388/g.50586  ORF Transcript_38388/g.50586 Transcript_38388/m.50586 type:complete len:712 (-) Transcript_38388:60-2195(-)